MAPKRKSGSSRPADKAIAKKAKSSVAAAPSALETVQSALSNVAENVSKAMEVAGELTLDDGSKTPVGVEEALGETVDVPALKKKGKQAQAAALEQGSKAVDKASESAKPLKGKAAKAAKAAEETVEDAITAVQPSVEKAAKPLKGKAAKAAQQAQETAEEVKDAAQDPKNRKKAEDFMHTAEEGVLAAVNKVGEVVGGVMKQFGEASGLTAEVEAVAPKIKEKAKKGKKAVEDKAEEVAEPAKKRGKQALDAAEEEAEIVVKSGKKAAEEATETVKSKANKGKRAAEETAGTAKAKGGKGKKAAEDTADAVAETATTGKRKAATAVDAIDSAPTTKKAKAVAGDAVEKGKKAGKATVKTVADAIEDVESDAEPFIHGFTSSEGEADSSDDESDDEDAAVLESGRRVDMSKVPMIAKDDKSVQARLKKAQKKKDSEKGTLYLGRIPHGFYEDEMREYFGQFGDVTQLRLARNRKTGASRHYAYIEMSSQSVAQIVAETMHNYLLMGHLLKCYVIPQDQVHPKLWEGANKKFRKLPRARLEKERQEKPRTEEQKAASNKRVKDKDSKRKQKIKDAGIDYDFEGHK